MWHHLRRISVLFLVALCSLCANVAFAGTPATQPVIAEYNFGYYALIPVVLQGKSAFFVLHTDTSNCVLDATQFPSLKKRDETADMLTARGHLSVAEFDPPDFDVGPFHLRKCPFVQRLDLSSFSMVFDRPIIGILGNDMLHGWVIQIDFDSHKLRILQPDSCNHSDWGTVESVHMDDRNSPGIEMKVAGANVRMELDTGDDGAIALPTDVFDALLAQTKSRTVSEPAVTASGLMDSREMRLPNFDFAGLHYHDLVVSESKDSTGRLGLSFFSRHMMTLDFANHRLYLKPGKEFDRHDEDDMSGLHIWRQDSHTVVAKLDPGSPADKAGIRVGDILLTVNAKPAADYDITDLRALLRSEDGKKITVTYRRDNTEQTATFTLHRVL